MKIRMINVIGKTLRVCYNDNNDKFKCKNLDDYPIDAKLSDSPSLESLSNLYGLNIKSKGYIDRFDVDEVLPGDMWWGKITMLDFYWDNDDGNHLYVKTPSGHIWDIMSSAKNCSKPNDRLHRCWTYTGKPPNITVSPSIDDGVYHGFLRNGEFTPNLNK